MSVKRKTQVVEIYYTIRNLIVNSTKISKEKYYETYFQENKTNFCEHGKK